MGLLPFILVSFLSLYFVVEQVSALTSVPKLLILKNSLSQQSISILRSSLKDESSLTRLETIGTKTKSLPATDESNLPRLDAMLTKTKWLPAIVGTLSLLFSSVPSAEAAKSGGRSGGSSFRAPSSVTRSSTRLGSSFSDYSTGTQYRSRPSVTIMPFMPSPFMPIMPFGYGYGGVGSVLPLALIAFGMYVILQNRITASDFSNIGDSGSLGSGATVMKLQIAVDSNWGAADNIMDTLSLLASKNRAMNGREDISKLLSETSLALLRKQSDWNSVAYEGEVFNRNQGAEPRFQRLAIAERAKFEKENPEGAMIRGSSSVNSGSQPTQAVVSLVVAMRGKSTAYSKSVTTLSEVRACLQSLASDALLDDGENVMAVEVLWSPFEKGEVVTPRELIEDYPDLIRL